MATKDIFKGVSNPHLMDPEVQRAIFEDPKYVDDYVKHVNSTFRPDKDYNDLGKVNLLQPELESLKNLWASKLQPAISNMGSYIKSNPWKSIGLGAAGAMNVGGLFDNDKIGGQFWGTLGGAGLGYGVLPKLLENVSPQAKLLTTLGGGALGALFDKLRQNKEDQYNAQMQQGGYY